jgi:hypothetical protein
MFLIRVSFQSMLCRGTIVRVKIQSKHATEIQKTWRGYIIRKRRAASNSISSRSRQRFYSFRAMSKQAKRIARAEEIKNAKNEQEVRILPEEEKAIPSSEQAPEKVRPPPPKVPVASENIRTMTRKSRIMLHGIRRLVIRRNNIKSTASLSTCTILAEEWEVEPLQGQCGMVPVEVISLIDKERAPEQAAPPVYSAAILPYEEVISRIDKQQTPEAAALVYFADIASDDIAEVSYRYAGSLF